MDSFVLDSIICARGFTFLCLHNRRNSMLSWILAVFVFLLGAKAFTKAGIPLTKTKNLQGVGGKICGVLCILLGLFLVFDGLFGMANIARMFAR